MAVRRGGGGAGRDVRGGRAGRRDGGGAVPVCAGPALVPRGAGGARRLRDAPHAARCGDLRRPGDRPSAPARARLAPGALARPPHRRMRQEPALRPIRRARPRPGRSEPAGRSGRGRRHGRADPREGQAPLRLAGPPLRHRGGRRIGPGRLGQVPAAPAEPDGPRVRQRDSARGRRRRPVPRRAAPDPPDQYVRPRWPTIARRTSSGSIEPALRWRTLPPGAITRVYGIGPGHSLSRASANLSRSSILAR